MFALESNGVLLYSQAMELVRYFQKNLGETPLEALNRFKAQNPEYSELKATYAGRLDPAAEGEILFLFGDLVHKKDEYLLHNKIYTATFALGVSTDTGDLLGVPTKSNNKSASNSLSNLDEEKIKELLTEIKNLKTQTYPAYSSKTVDGKPLFAHTREGNEVERPIRNIEIFDCSLVDQKNIIKEELLERVKKICALVTGDFRQNEIIKSWEELINEKQNQIDKNLPDEIRLLTLSLHVSSGTYIRTMTEVFEKVFGVPTVLFELKREKIKPRL